MQLPDDLKPFNEKIARRIARIIGPQGACAQAVKELDERRARGEKADIFQSASVNAMFVV